MPLNTENTPLPKKPLKAEEPEPEPEPVEQATAAPGEKRAVKKATAKKMPASGLCEEPVTLSSGVHPCDREFDHTGRHSYRGE